jgi:hypothetical protein
MFDKDPLSAIEAVTAAQWLAFAPLAHQATAVMRDRGVLAALAAAAPSQGCSIDEVASATGLSTYAARVLLEAGLGCASCGATTSASTSASSACFCSKTR